MCCGRSRHPDKGLPHRSPVGPFRRRQPHGLLKPLRRRRLDAWSQRPHGDAQSILEDEIMAKVLRTWTFWIKAALEDECRDYLERHVLRDLRGQSGNLRASALFRGLGDGTTQVVVASVWESMDCIRAYDGGGTSRPAIAPDIHAKILDRDSKIRYFAIDSLDDIVAAKLWDDGMESASSAQGG